MQEPDKEVHQIHSKNLTLEIWGIPGLRPSFKSWILEYPGECMEIADEWTKDPFKARRLVKDIGHTFSIEKSRG